MAQERSKAAREKLLEFRPDHPPKFEAADAAAIQALAQGKATAEQQRRALSWIVGDGRTFVDSACGTYDQTFVPGGNDAQRASDFLSGRRFAGNAIVKLINIKLGALQRREP